MRFEEYWREEQQDKANEETETTYRGKKGLGDKLKASAEVIYT
jgi:hypothetical protein